MDNLAAERNERDASTIVVGRVLFVQKFLRVLQETTNDAHLAGVILSSLNSRLDLGITREDVRSAILLELDIENQKIQDEEDNLSYEN